MSASISQSATSFGSVSAAKGGHHVPDADVARRYTRSIANLKAAIRIADEATGYDNTDSTPRKIFEAHQGTITWRAAALAAWADI